MQLGRALAVEPFIGLFERVDAREAMAKHHGAALGKIVSADQASLGQRLVRGFERQQRKKIQRSADPPAERCLEGPEHVAVDERAGRLGRRRTVRSWVEDVAADTAPAVPRRQPRRLGGVTERRNRAHARHDDPPGVGGHWART